VAERFAAAVAQAEKPTAPQAPVAVP